MAHRRKGIAGRPKKGKEKTNNAAFKSGSKLPTDDAKEKAAMMFAVGAKAKDVAEAVGRTEAAIRKWEGQVHFAEMILKAKANLPKPKNDDLFGELYKINLQALIKWHRQILDNEETRVASFARDLINLNRNLLLKIPNPTLPMGFEAVEDETVEVTDLEFI